MIKLVGIAVVAVGFALRVNTLLVVLVAGLVTGAVSGMNLVDVISQFGAAFVENRYVTLPVVLMLPLIGMLERHGLQERAETLIRGRRAATAGRVLLLYSALRQVAVSLGVKIGDHAATVRPLVVPMAEAAALQQTEPRPPEAPVSATTGTRTLPEAVVAAIRAHAAAAENVGNFFGEDIFVAVGGVLLMNGFFQSIGMPVGVWALALWGIPTAVVAFVLMAWRTRALDRRINRDIGAATKAPREGGGESGAAAKTDADSSA